MKDNLAKINMYLALVTLVIFIIGFTLVFLLTNGIRINRKIGYNENGLELVYYEQVYHVFMEQEIFLQVENKTENTIAYLTVKEKNSGKESTIHKVLPGRKTKLYFSLDSYFEKAEFEIVNLRFVEMNLK